MFTKKVKVGQAHVYKEVINWNAVLGAIGLGVAVLVLLVRCTR